MAKTPTSGHWLLSLIAFVVLAVAFVKFADRLLGTWIPKISTVGYVAITAALLVLTIKFTLNGLRKKDFKLHEQGHDVSLLAAGTAIPAAAGIAIKQRMDSGKLQAGIGDWIFFALLAIASVFITALLAQVAEESIEGNGGKLTFRSSLCACGNLALGAGSFILYLLMVLLKAQG